MAKFLFLVFILLPSFLHAQKGEKNFIYMSNINHADMQGKKIVEFIRAEISTVVLTSDGLEVSRVENYGYLVAFKTTKGKNLGIRGVNIENNTTGELDHYPIGTKDGLKFEKIVNNSIYLKSPTISGGEKEYDIYMICRFIDDFNTE